MDIFSKRNIYVTGTELVCNRHLNAKGLLLPVLLPGLQYVYRPYRIKGNVMQSLLQSLRKKVNDSKPGFQNIDDFSDEDFCMVSPVTKLQFENIFNFCEDVTEDFQFRHVSKKDLLTFLCKLRQGLSDSFLKIIFNYSTRQAVSLAISSVRQSLLYRFVPQNIGLNAITRNDFINSHVTEFSNELYNPEPKTPVLFAI